jgi:flagellar protein FliL
MLGKLIGNKLMLGALVGVLGGLVVAVLMVVVGGVGSGATPAEAAGAKPGEKTASAAKDKSRPGVEPGRFGPTYVVRDRIVNLADPGGRRYLRFTVAVEFAEHADEKKAAAPAGTSQNHLMVYLPEDAAEYREVQGGREKDADKAFQTQIKRYAAAIEDAVTTVLSSKTYDEVRSPEGKEAAKHEIKARVQQVVGEAEHVTNVYFTDFVVQ